MLKTGCHLQDVIIWSILLLGLLAVALLSIFLTFDVAKTPVLEESWIARLSANLIGYSTLFIPGVIILRYVRKTNYMERRNTGCMPWVIRMCISGNDGDKLPTVTSTATIKERTFFQDTALLILCFVGLQGSYLTWGILQEKIMTQEYVTISGDKTKFRDSQFLVFVNRVLAFVVAAIYVCIRNQPRHTAPLYKYSYCSFSNIMSSWCQYEALKFVSFPTQVLAKASKVIPVMLMGKIVSKKKYEYYEYVTAVLISLGMTFFLLGSGEEKASPSTTVSGIIILVGYMAFDSFTSNWQSELFTQYKMTSMQMMCGVNLFSCLLTAISLFQQGGFVTSVSFMLQTPVFLFDCVILSACSAFGQLFIYYTISQFGAVVFVIIMTIRQGLAIILSCIIYSHPVSAMGIIGVFIVFVAIFLRIYCNHRMKALRRSASSRT